MAAVIFVGIRRPVLEMYQTILSAKQLNLEILLITDHSPAVPSAFADVFVGSFDDEQPMLDQVDAWASTYQLMGVVNWHDITTPLRARIGQHLGLPAVSETAALISRDKLKMKEILSVHAPELLPAYTEIKDETRLTDWCEKHPGPYVLKPRSGTSSKGVFEANTATEARQRYRQLLSYLAHSSDPLFAEFQNAAIIEEKLVGREVSMDGIISHGAVSFFDIVDFKSTDFHHLDYYKIYPSSLTEGEKQSIYAIAEKVLRLFSYDECAFHFEGIITPRGFKFYEVAARPGAGCIATHLIRLAYGIDYVGTYIAAMCRISDRVVCPKISKPTYHGIVYSLAESEGIFTGVSGIDRLLELPGIQFVGLDATLGDHVALPPEDFTSCKCFYCIVSSTEYGEVERLLEIIPRIARVVITCDSES